MDAGLRAAGSAGWEIAADPERTTTRARAVLERSERGVPAHLI